MRQNTKGRAARVPSRITAGEANALRAYWGTARLASVQRGKIRAVVYLSKDEVAAMVADEHLGERVRFRSEGNPVLARGRALRFALRSYLKSAGVIGGGK